MYKKVIFLFLGAVLTAGYSNAQLTLGTKEFSLGARAGFTFPSFGGRDGGELANESSIGFQLGIVGETALTQSEDWNLQLGILFSQQGGDYTYGNGRRTYYYTTTLNYFQVPVNILYKTEIGNSNSALFFHAGPYLGLCLGGKISDEEDTEKLIVGTVLKRFDIGMGIGAGWQCLQHLQLDIGYQFGFMSVFKDFDVSNNALTMTATWFFDEF